MNIQGVVLDDQGSELSTVPVVLGGGKSRGISRADGKFDFYDVPSGKKNCKRYLVRNSSQIL
jgi:hypothetical protein